MVLKLCFLTNEWPFFKVYILPLDIVAMDRVHWFLISVYGAVWVVVQPFGVSTRSAFRCQVLFL